MGIFDALKGLFGGSKHDVPINSDPKQSNPREYFIKPGWANEDEDSDDDLVMRNPHNHANMFSVFSNPLEIHRYFEHQMNEMSKHFEEALSSNDLSNQNGIDSFFGQTPFFKSGQIPAILPPSDEIQKGGSLRDKCLKPNARQPKREVAEDSDLDNELKNGQIQLFKSPPAVLPKTSAPHVFSSQVFTRVVRHPDGSVEEIRTKQIGDQKYTKVTRTDLAGHINIHEDIVNIDENQLKEFQSVGDASLPRMNHFGDWFRFRL